MNEKNNEKQGGEEIRKNAFPTELELVGNIAPNSIAVDEQKGIAKFSVAVYNGHARDPLWYNCTAFKKEGSKLFEDLQAIQKEGKGVQVQVKGGISQNSVEKDGEKKYYTNFNVATFAQTEEFQKSGVKLALKGKVAKPLETHQKTSITPSGKEVNKEFARVVLVAETAKGPSFYSFLVANKEQIEHLKTLKKGDKLELKNMQIDPSGKMKLQKATSINGQILEKIVNIQKEKGK